MDLLNNSFIQLLNTSANSSDTNIITIFIVLIGTFIIASFIAWVYKKTYNVQGQPKNEYAKTIIALSVVISMIMLSVGASIAGAFTMAGALSMVRFRNNIKDTRDIGFIFFAIAVGMSMGMKFYSLAIIGAIVISTIFYVMYHFNLFSIGVEKFNYTLETNLDENADLDNIFEKIFEKYQLTSTILNVEFTKELNENMEKIPLNKISFKLESTKILETKNFVDEIKTINGNRNVILRKEF